jgi:hypothetical protein
MSKEHIGSKEYLAMWTSQLEQLVNVDNRPAEWLELLSKISDKQQLWIEQWGIKWDSVLCRNNQYFILSTKTRGIQCRLIILPITLSTELAMIYNLSLLHGEAIDIDSVLTVSEFKELMTDG